ncbi:hypothetical protein VMCG_07384 [Cytospora schulzeri]|uniref:Uncharacterized protein n=1 Tax=Cytospora schulzeri TaxID=448051 RepID=A0A423W2Z3_9PEZI|nr:hypothetical protein VMCG_07384 [Valsa malicola]
MPTLFQTPRSGRPFGGIVNPFEGTRPTPPPPTPSSPTNPNAWRDAFGPNPFNPEVQGRQPPAGPTPPPIWGHPDYQPHLPPRQQPYREDIPYFTFQRRAIRSSPPPPPPPPPPPDAAAATTSIPVIPVLIPLGTNGTAGTAPQPIIPLTITLTALLTNALQTLLTSCAGHAARSLTTIHDAALFLWTTTLPALAGVLAGLAWALARCAALGLAAWFLLRVANRLFRMATEVLLGWSWKMVPGAGSYGLRAEFTSWSVTPAGGGGGGGGGLVAAVAPGNGGDGGGASLQATCLSTNTWPYYYDTAFLGRATSLMEQCPADGFDLLKAWNISYVWNVTITTVTGILWDNFIEPIDREEPW